MGHGSSDIFCTETQGEIAVAMALHHQMGLSVTSKAHGMENHVVGQMRSIPGGIGKSMENWVEQYHQTGYRFDMSYCRAGKLENQALIKNGEEGEASFHIDE